MVQAERTAKGREPEVLKCKALTVLVKGSKKDPRKVPRGWISQSIVGHLEEVGVCPKGTGEPWQNFEQGWGGSDEVYSDV